MSVIIRKGAEDDIIDWTLYFQTKQEKVAKKFADGLKRAIDLLERCPLSGAELGIFSDGVWLRFQVIPGFQHHLILHSPLADGVEIHRIVDGRRDLNALFAS